MFGIVPVDRRRNQLIGRERDMMDLDRVFDDLFNGFAFPTYLNRSELMKVDIKEDDDTYLMEAEVPGIDKENINIEIVEGCLTISVNKEDQFEARNENYIRRERRSSAISRSFSLEDVDADKISAKLENGVLSICLPKMQQSVRHPAHKIEISG